MAELAAFLAVAAEGNVSAAADHELVVAGFFLALLRWTGAELNGAAVGVGLYHTDGLEQIGRLSKLQKLNLRFTRVGPGGKGLGI